MEHESRRPSGRGDIKLKPNEYLAYTDDTKGGNIYTLAGPFADAFGASNTPVIFNPKTKRFVDSDAEQAVQQFTIAPEGFYVVLKNPSENG